MKTAARMHAFVAVLVAWGVAGCAAQGAAQKPGFGDWVLPERVRVAAPALCRDTPVDGNGTPLLDVPVVSRAGMTEQAEAALVEVLGRTLGAPSVELPVDCGDFTSARALDLADWGRPLPPERYGAALRGGEGAGSGWDALLVTVVDTREICHTAVEGQPGVACEESGMTLSAFLFDKDGAVVWKSFTRHPLGQGFPAPSQVEAGRLLAPYPTRPKR